MPVQPLLFVHAAGDKRHRLGSSHLIDSLARELGPQYRVIAPDMPGADDPHYQAWRDEIERQLEAIGRPVVLVGHSFGASVLLKYLAEGPPPTPIRGLFLAATPWWGPEFEDFALPADFAARLPKVPTFLYHSLDDGVIPYSHAEQFARVLPHATLRPIQGSEHSFLDGLPELVDDLRSLEA